MQSGDANPAHPALKLLVVEAWQALAHLDADRLDEIAHKCQVLTGDLDGNMTPESRAALADEARQAAGDMAVFARVLEVTRANLDVMNRLRELRAGRLEYGRRDELARSGPPEIGPSRSGNGND